MNENEEKQLTDEDKTIKEIHEHILCVSRLIETLCCELFKKSCRHDQSKLEEPELQMYTKVNSKLQNLTYGSDEYKEQLKDMGAPLQHHYEFNDHHPEHYKNGISSMNLINIVEMLCDWKTAAIRHNDKNFKKSIDINISRFNIDGQLKDIILNTIPYLHVFTIDIYNEYFSKILNTLYSDDEDDIIQKFNSMQITDTDRKQFLLVFNKLQMYIKYRINQEYEKLEVFSDCFILENGRNVKITIRPLVGLSIGDYMNKPTE